MGTFENIESAPNFKFNRNDDLLRGAYDDLDSGGGYHLVSSAAVAVNSLTSVGGVTAGAIGTTATASGALKESGGALARDVSSAARSTVNGITSGLNSMGNDICHLF